MAKMSKRLITKLGAVLYRESCKLTPAPALHRVTLVRVANAMVDVLDDEGLDFRLFLQAAGADDEEQARGRMKL